MRFARALLARVFCPTLQLASTPPPGRYAVSCVLASNVEGQQDLRTLRDASSQPCSHRQRRRQHRVPARYAAARRRGLAARLARLWHSEAELNRCALGLGPDEMDNLVGRTAGLMVPVGGLPVSLDDLTGRPIAPPSIRSVCDRRSAHPPAPKERCALGSSSLLSLTFQPRQPEAARSLERSLASRWTPAARRLRLPSAAPLPLALPPGAPACASSARCAPRQRPLAQQRPRGLPGHRLRS